MDEPALTLLAVEVVYALPHEQILVRVLVTPGAIVRDAIRLSGLAARYPEISEQLAVEGSAGIFGKAVALDRVVCDGDRVEIYRPLTVDPKEARRRRVHLRTAKQNASPTGKLRK